MEEETLKEVATQTLQAQKAKELLRKYEVPGGERGLLRFEGVEGKDVYNISAPFVFGEKLYLAGRVENRTDEFDSKAYFFEPKFLPNTLNKKENSLPESNRILFFLQNSVWVTAEEAEVLTLQDPFITHFSSEIVVGGVKVEPREYPKPPLYRTEFYRGKDLKNLNKFAEGPLFMKDIRLIELPSEEILVFTRPQGEIGGRGKIGYLKITNLDELNQIDLYSQSKIIEGQFHPEEWGGANELRLLPDGRVGVLGHIAYIDERNNKHYYAMSFVFNPNTGEVTPLKIIATRKDFPSAPSKKSPILDDVIFPGGILSSSEETILFAGLSDAASGYLKIKNPFL